MRTISPLPRIRAVCLAACVCITCDRQAQEECPEVDTADLECPAAIGPFELGECLVPDGPDIAIEAGLSGSVLDVNVRNVYFRDDNEICGYASRDDSEIRILLQPCILVPAGGVSKGDCQYASISFEVDEVDVSDATSVTVSYRVDMPVGSPLQEPKMVSAPLP